LQPTDSCSIQRLGANLIATVWRGREKLHYLNPTPINEIYERRIHKYERRRLRALDIGHVVVKTRASPLDPQELERSLRLEGSGERILVLTRVLGRHSVLICRVDRDQTDT